MEEYKDYMLNGKSRRGNNMGSSGDEGSATESGISNVKIPANLAFARNISRIYGRLVKNARARSNQNICRGQPEVEKFPSSYEERAADGILWKVIPHGAPHFNNPLE